MEGPVTQTRAAWRAADALLIAALAVAGSALVALVGVRLLPTLDADTLHTWLMVADIVERGGDVVWQCTTNFYFFPAAFFVAFGQLFFGELGPGHVAAFALQALTAGVAAAVLAGVVNPGLPVRLRALAGLAFLGLYLVASAALPFFGEMNFAPTSHGMHFPVAILVLAAFVATVTTPSRGATTAFVVLGALLTLSDVIFFFWLFGPLIAASLAAAVLVPAVRRQVPRLTALIVAPLLLSTAAKFGVEATGRFTRRSGGAGQGSILASLEAFFGPVLAMPEAPWVGALVVAALGVAAGTLWLATDPERRAALRDALGDIGTQRLLWFAGISALGIAIALAFPIVTATLKDQAGARYFQNAVFLPLLWLTCAASTRAPALRGFAAAALALTLAVVVAGRSELAPGGFRTPYPERVAALDAIVAEHGLRSGLAEYWRVNEARALSRRGVELVAVKQTLQPYVWSASADWYFATPSWDFVLMRRLDPERVRRVLGPPRSVATRGDVEVWIYDPVADAERFAPVRARLLKEVRHRDLMVRPEWRTLETKPEAGSVP